MQSRFVRGRGLHEQPCFHYLDTKKENALSSQFWDWKWKFDFSSSEFWDEKFVLVDLVSKFVFRKSRELSNHSNPVLQQAGNSWMQDSYQGIVYPWIRTKLWSGILTTKRFGSCIPKQIRFREFESFMFSNIWFVDLVGSDNFEKIWRFRVTRGWTK